MKFHLAHVIPDPRLHGLNGYAEVIDTVRWGLEALGHEVTYGINEFATAARNIVFGGQVLTAAQQQRLGPDTIVYNFEQLRGNDIDRLPEATRANAARFQIWEYSEFNLPAWEAMGTARPVRHVPVGYAPVLERLPAADQDIDVLIYGLTNELRLNAYHALCMGGLTAVFVCGLYGAGRDSLIARARTVVNVSLYQRSRIFEIVRASYLFANRKAVIAHVDPDTGIESDILGAFHASTARSLVGDVERLVRNPVLRHELEERAYEALKRRDIRAILGAALT